MDNPFPPAEFLLLYRRIPQQHWRKKDGSVKEAAFLLRDGEHGLSCFLANRVSSPRALLDDYRLKTIAKLDNPDTSPEERAKIQQRLDDGKLEPEALYDGGWRVAALSTRHIPPDRFHLDPPDGEDDGHVNLKGSVEDFETFSLEWKDVAKVLSREETLNL